MLQIEKALIDKAALKLANRLLATPVLSCSIGDGHGMCAMYFEAMWRLSGDEKWRDESRNQLELGCQALGKSALSTSFFRSGTGFGWIVATIGESVGYEDAPDVVAEIGRVYMGALKKKNTDDYDLINGIVGLAVFARALPDEMRQEFLDQLWIQLIVLMPPFCPGFHWHAHAFPAGENLGLAHGIPGIIAAFSAALHEGWDCADASRSLVACGHWLWMQRVYLDNTWHFPYSVAATAPARLGWCYGVLGIGVAFAWLAALDSTFSPMVTACINAATTERKSSTHGMVDGSVCHGLAGYAYILERLYESSEASIPEFSAGETKAAHILLQEIAASAEIEHETPEGTQVFHSILEGAPGVVLAYASMHLKPCRVWQGLLLLDIPIRKTATTLRDIA